MEGTVGKDLKSLHLSEEEALICSEWRRLMKVTRSIIMLPGFLGIIVVRTGCVICCRIITRRVSAGFV